MVAWKSRSPRPETRSTSERVLAKVSESYLEFDNSRREVFESLPLKSNLQQRSIEINQKEKQQTIKFSFVSKEQKDTFKYKETFELSNYQKVPSYLTYPYIYEGYRSDFSLKLCLKSVFKKHNETGNIWTHLFAFFYFFFFFVYTFVFVLRPEDPFQDKMFFFVFHAGALANFLTSVSYHTFNCNSLKTCHFVSKLDFGGISNHICCSWLLLANYLFHDHFYVQCIYIFLISCHSIFMLVSPRIVESHNVRVFIFALMGIFGIVPIFHWIFVNGWNSEVVTLFFWRFPACWLIYSTGLCIFLYKAPERFYPGKFDYWFNSHQIWHCFIWFGNAWFMWIVISLAIYHQKKLMI